MNEPHVTKSAFGTMKAVLDIVATIAVIVLAVVVGWTLLQRPVGSPVRVAAAGRPAARPSAAPLPTEPVSLDGAVTSGSRQAHVAVIEYSEFKCPYCGAFARDTWPSLKTKYVDSGKVLVAFRHFPLDSLHPFARPAAQAAECVGRQGKFWEFHDLLFRDQKALDATMVDSYITTTGVDRKVYEACLKTAVAAKVQADVVSGESLGVTGTPTFFMGLVEPDGRVLLKERMTGAQPVAQFEGTLNRLLADTTRTSK
jgi:protein-disulfide isomerase